MASSDTVPLDPSAADALELRLHPDDVERLMRLPDLARLRAGRARNAAVELVWHDTPDGALAAEGLSLCERKAGRGTVWQMHRLRGSGAATWPPGTPPPLVAATDRLADLGQKLPSPLLPLAACTGVLRSLPLGAAAGGMTVTLLQGTLRAVAAEQPVCRVMLGGPAAEIEALALALTQHVRLMVPDAALAAEACRTAGRTVAATAIGAPDVPANVSVADAFAVLAGHLTGVILHWAPAAGTTAAEPVHQIRVAVRRLRSAMALFRRAIGDEVAASVKHDLKALQLVLGPARDWDVFTAGTGRAVAAALPDDQPLARLLAAAERRRQDAYADLRGFLDSAAFRRLAIRLACLAAFRPWDGHPPPEAGTEEAEKRATTLAAPLAEFAGRALSRRLDRVLAPGDDLSLLSAAELHALRIQGKHLRYAAEFFAPLHPARETRRFLRRIATLQDRLGHLNDNTVAASLMAELGATSGGRGYAVGVVRGFVAAGQRGARTQMERSWHKFRKTAPFWS